uniref:G-protein coupled receptors family 1 profile domain-containing protein n=1 Tax=Leptobrachium leishanense TaxID=445787 RepID=A0A8C5LZ26_9ANUR
MMQNSTSLSDSPMLTKIYNSKAAELGRVILTGPIILSFCYFLYFAIVILHFYYSSPRVREQARYVLFAHMIINDTLYLGLSLIFILASLFLLYMPVPICFVILMLATTTFKITPYNLAVMALERYAAICFPLRHVTLCTPQRSNVAIALIWAIGMAPSIADIFALSMSSEREFLYLSVICNRETMTRNALQSFIRSSSSIGSLTLVAVIILFTYVKVMLVARQISSGSSSASKASKTVLLHAFQLLLCMVSLTTTFTESYLREHVLLLSLGNFILLMCLPRFLSPLLYGMRDEVFKQCVRKLYPQRLRSCTCSRFRSNNCITSVS